MMQFSPDVSYAIETKWKKVHVVIIITHPFPVCDLQPGEPSLGEQARNIDMFGAFQKDDDDNSTSWGYSN